MYFYFTKIYLKNNIKILIKFNTALGLSDISLIFFSYK